MSTPTLSTSAQQFASGVSAGTGIDRNVLTAWVAQESGWNKTKTGFNYLNIGPGRKYASVSEAIKATVSLLKSKTYQGIQSATGKGPQAQISAIVASPWDAGHYGAAQGENRLADTYSTVVNSVKDAIAKFLRPVQGGTVTGNFGEDRGDHAHQGIDIAIPQGSSVASSISGVVKYAGAASGYGNLIEVVDNNGFSTKYGHLSNIKVKAGDQVRQGQVIALSGGTPGTAGAGTSTGAHLHFEILQGGKAVDPEKYLSTSSTYDYTNADTANWFSDVTGIDKALSNAGDALVKGLVYIVFLAGALALIGLGLSRLTSVSAGDVVSKGSNVAGALALIPK